MDAVDVVLTLIVVGLGLGLEFEDEVHPATTNGAATSTTIIKSRYLLTLIPPKLVESQDINASRENNLLPLFA